MTALAVGYKSKAPEPWNLAIFVVLSSFLLMLVFAPFILGILEWPSTIGPGLGILLLVGNMGPTIVAFVMTAITEGKPGVRAL